MWLKAGETKTVTIDLPMHDVTFWSNFHKKMIVEPGDFLIEVGRSSADLPCKAQLTVSGAWNAELYNVYAVADKYIYAIGQQGHIQISATLEDATHLNINDHPLLFASSDEAVATVDKNGTVTAKASGTATITASVVYGGKGMSANVPVAVK